MRFQLCVNTHGFGMAGWCDGQVFINFCPYSVSRVYKFQTKYIQTGGKGKPIINCLSKVLGQDYGTALICLDTDCTGLWNYNMGWTQFFQTVFPEYVLLLLVLTLQNLP